MVGVLLGLGLLAGWAASTAVTGGVRVISSKRWRTARAGVQIPDAAAAYLDLLAEQTGLDLVVTSGTRTAAQQVRAMRTKITQGATLKDLLDLYADDEQVEELWPSLLAGDMETAAEILEENMARGRYLSRHLSTGADSWALDIDDPKDPTERARLIEVAKALGGKALDEGNHIHIEHRGRRNV